MGADPVGSIRLNALEIKRILKEVVHKSSIRFDHLSEEELRAIRQKKGIAVDRMRNAQNDRSFHRFVLQPEGNIWICDCSGKAVSSGMTFQPPTNWG